MGTPQNPLQLADWRRRVARLYGQVRDMGQHDPVAAWHAFCQTRDQLFLEHSQSPLSDAQRPFFTTLSYFAYDPAWRLVGRLERSVTPQTLVVELDGDGRFAYTRIAAVHFDVPDGTAVQLSLYWVEGYGGGLFLPFKDVTNGNETYGGGRYLYDTIKGADLGAGDETIFLDFNFGYNPSCAYSLTYTCPLPPRENWLKVPIRAGEKAFKLAIAN